MGDKWIPVDRIMPDIIEYCYVTSGYQSKIVEIITLDGCIYKASLQVHPTEDGSLNGGNMECWEGSISNRILFVDGEILEKI